MTFFLQKNEIEERINKSKNVIIVENLKGAALRSGECALHGSGNDVGQPIDSIEFRDIEEDDRTAFNVPKTTPEKQKYAIIRKIIAKEGMDPLLNTQEYIRLPRAGRINEAILTNEITFVAEKLVTNVAFLFHVEDMKTGKYKPGGIINAFALRCEIQSTSEGQPAKPKSIAPDSFCSFVRESDCSKRIWDAIVAAHMEVSRQMGCGGAWDGRNKSAALKGINVEAMNYFHADMMFQRNELLELNHNGKRRQKAMNADCSNENMEVSTSGRMFRAIEEPALKRMRTVLGDTFAVVNTKPVPSATDLRTKKPKPKARVTCNNLTTLRMATCREEDTSDEWEKKLAVPAAPPSSDPTTNNDVDMWESVLQADLLAAEKKKKNKRCPCKGVDIEHTTDDLGLCILKFYIKFSKIKGSSDIAREVRGEDLNKETTLVLETGNRFRCGDMQKTHIVKSIDQEKEEVTFMRCRDEDENMITLACNEVEALVKAYQDAMLHRNKQRTVTPSPIPAQS